MTHVNMYACMYVCTLNTNANRPFSEEQSSILKFHLHPLEGQYFCKSVAYLRKLHSRGFNECRFPHFQKSQELALSGGVDFKTSANRRLSFGRSAILVLTFLL